ncbi:MULTISPECIES: TfoX/Sxy family protein [unclassified Gordonia (in: high G+C Gram-positive bacteria)]
MAYDEDLAHRIRALLTSEPDLREKSMFGGLAFLVNGNMAVAASGHGGLMVRVPAEITESLLEHAHTEPMIMSGRHARGWLRVSADGIRTERQLRRWVTIGADHARKLPPK